MEIILKQDLAFLHTVKLFQVLLFNNHNLTSVICLHTACSIWLIDRTLSDATTPGKSGPGNSGSEGVLHIPQISKVGTSPSDGLMLCPGHSLGESYLSAEMQSVYSTAPPSLHQTAVEEEWNKMSKEFISKTCKLFRRYVDTIIEKNYGHIE